MTVIEVFADITCPFAHVGLRRLVERRAALGADFAVRVRAWPLELVNGRPLEAGPVGEKVAVLRESAAADLFANFDPSRFPYTTLPACAVVAAAYRTDLATGERAALAVREELFEHGVDISDTGVLQSLARRLDVHVPLDAEDDVIADWREGERRGVQGSPHFFVGEHDYFCPALLIEHEAGRLRVTPDPARFEAFIEECIGGGRSRARAAV